MGTIQKLCVKPAANNSTSPRTGDSIQEKATLSANQITAAASMVRAGWMRLPLVEIRIEPKSAPAAKLAINQPRPVWSTP